MIKHVLTERSRTRSIIENLHTENLSQVGKLLTECHWSLSQNFQVSCPETDFIVETLEKYSILGARMIGGEFGGCVLVLDKKSRSKEIKGNMENLYFNRFHRKLEFYHFNISDGVREIT